MTAGDWATWAGVGVAIAGVAWGIVQARAAKRVARDADRKADEALEESRRQSDAQEGMRAELARIASQVEAPAVKLVIETVDEYTFWLRNEGTATVELTVEPPPNVKHFRMDPHGPVAPGQAVRFVMFAVSAMGGEQPDSLRVWVAGFDAPLHIPFPR